MPTSVSDRSVAKNVLWSPKIEIAVAPTQSAYMLDVTWVMHLSNGVVVHHALPPPYPALDFQITVSNTFHRLAEEFLQTSGFSMSAKSSNHSTIVKRMCGRQTATSTVALRWRKIAARNRCRDPSHGQFWVTSHKSLPVFATRSVRPTCKSNLCDPNLSNPLPLDALATSCPGRLAGAALL